MTARRPDAADAEPSSRPRWYEGRATRRAALAAVVGTQLALSLWRLGTPSWEVDELVYARAGRSYAAGDLTTNLEHPPLAKYAIGLSQALLGDGTGAARLPGVVAGIAIGAGLFFLGRWAAGFWAGVAAWAAWAVLPRSVGLMAAGTDVTMVRYERVAQLEVFVAAGMVASLLAGWMWATTGRSRWAVGTGLCVGLATAAKLPGATAAVVVVAAVFAIQRSWRMVGQAALAGTCAVATFSLTYLPFGRTGPDAVRHMLDFQLARTGQSVYAGGRVWDDPPWWVFLAYQVEADGWVLTVATVVAVGAALVLVRHPLRWYLFAAAVVPLAALTVSPVVIRHYRYIALPAQTALIALGLVALLRRRGWARVVGAVACLPFLVAGVREVDRVASLQPTDYAAVGEVLRRHENPTVVLRGFRDVAQEYAPTAEFLHDLPDDGREDMSEVVAIVLDPTSTIRIPAPELVAAATERGMTETRFGRLQVFLDPDLASATDGSTR